MDNLDVNTSYLLNNAANYISKYLRINTISGAFGNVNSFTSYFVSLQLAPVLLFETIRPKSQCVLITADDQKARWTADRIQAGIIWHNDWAVDGTNLPGGGYKRSGYGRDGGVDGVYSHGQTKRISKRLY